MEWVKCSHYFDLIKMCYSKLPRICNDTKFYLPHIGKNACKYPCIHNFIKIWFNM